MARLGRSYSNRPIIRAAPLASGPSGSIAGAWQEAAASWAVVAVGITALSAAWVEAPSAFAVVAEGTDLTPIIVKIAPFFSTDTITTPGYRLYHYAAGALTADGAHQTSGIDAVPNITNGYSVALNVVKMTLDADGGYRGVIVWDSGGGSPFYVQDEVYVPPPEIDMAQTVPTSNAAQSVGDALNAARAQGFGKWALSGTTLTLYAANGSTVVRTFTLDSSSAPTSRT